MHPLHDIYEQVDEIFATPIERRCVRTMLITAYVRGAREVMTATLEAASKVRSVPRDEPAESSGEQENEFVKRLLAPINRGR